jgi:hypothetical protein
MQTRIDHDHLPRIGAVTEPRLRPKADASRADLRPRVMRRRKPIAPAHASIAAAGPVAGRGLAPRWRRRARWRAVSLRLSRSPNVETRTEGSHEYERGHGANGHVEGCGRDAELRGPGARGRFCSVSPAGRPTRACSRISPDDWPTAIRSSPTTSGATCAERSTVSRRTSRSRCTPMPRRSSGRRRGVGVRVREQRRRHDRARARRAPPRCRPSRAARLRDRLWQRVRE